MAVRAPIPVNLNPSASTASFTPSTVYSRSSRFLGMASPEPDRATTAQVDQNIESSSTQQSTPREDGVSTLPPVEKINSDTDKNDQHSQPVDGEPPSLDATKRGLVSPVRSGPLKIDVDKSTTYASTSVKEDEPPISVIHAPLGFGKFGQTKPLKVTKPSTAETTPTPPSTTVPPKDMGTSTIVSTTSSDSIASDVTVTRIVGEDVEVPEKPSTLIPPLQTHLPIAGEWTKTPRAQTRRDYGVFARPGSSLSSLASISEADDDHPDLPTDYSIDEVDQADERPIFYRNDEEEILTLQTALTECWTLCNTLAGLSYVHREKIFSKKGNLQQQAWKSCWRLCQDLYNAQTETTPTNVQLTLDLCREFCQSLFEVRARDDETADSVLRVSFELNNHLFNTHDRNLPEAFSERTLDFYITLCHRMVRQRATGVEETGSLLQSCWSLAEMLFSIRQTRREGRVPDEDLLSSAIQSCWELCDLFREGWTQIRPDRQTPRPAQTTITQAFQQARKEYPTYPTYHQTAPDPTPRGNKMIPETPTTVFEDMIADSPWETNAPNIVVLGPGESPVPTSASSIAPPSSAAPLQQAQQPRQTAFRWPTVNSKSSATTFSESSERSLSNSVSTIRSPNDDPNMALLKSLFVRAAMHTNRGFAPLASTPLNATSSQTSLPLFVKSLPEIAFGSQAWQMGLLDNYRKAIANDTTFKTLGIAANPTLLGIDGDEATHQKIKVDTARAIQNVVEGNFGWGWLRELFRYTFDAYVEDVLAE